MIYQLKLYYGALVGDKVAYSAEISFEDCTKPFDGLIDEEPIRLHLSQKIKIDGFDPNDFTFDWLTQEQYDNKIESVVSEHFELN